MLQLWTRCVCRRVVAFCRGRKYLGVVFVVTIIWAAANYISLHDLQHATTAAEQPTPSIRNAVTSTHNTTRRKQELDEGANRLSTTLRGQPLIDYLGAHLHVYYVRSAAGVDVVLTNSGPLDIPPGSSWSIYFSQAGALSDVRRRVRMSLENVDGWLYRVKTVVSNVTDESFGGLLSHHNLTLFTRVRLKSLSYAFPRWYAVGDPGTQPRVLRNTDSAAMDFVKCFDDDDDVRLARHRHLANMAAAEAHPGPQVSAKPIIPTPLKMALDSVSAVPDKGGQVHIDTSWTVVYDGQQLRNEANFIAKKLNIKTAEAVAKDSDRGQVIHLHVSLNTDINKLAGTHQSLSKSEGYVLEVLPGRRRVDVTGTTTAGVFYGLQSLLSLLVASADERTLPAVRVVDAPRLSYRALMIDVARNFLDKRFIVGLLDVMAMYKMNALHLHLSDDQGWRLQVPTLPELTDIGSRRSHDADQQSSLLSYLGSGPFHSNGTGNGYYSASDYRDILRRASDLHIQVIPEFDMPGHMHAAIQSMRVRTAKLQNQGFTDAGQEFQLSDPEDKSNYVGINKQRDTVINPCLNSTYRFVEEVLKHLVSLHKDIQPLRTVHLGGDEVPKDALKASPVCHSLLGKYSRQSVGLRLHFVRHAVDIAARLGVETVQVWQDAVSNLARHPVNQSEWNAGVKLRVNAWTAHKGFSAFDFANAGYQVVMSHSSQLYLDHPYERDTKELGLFWATKSVDTRAVFSYHLPPTSHATRYSLLQRLCDIYAETRCPSLNRPDNIVGMETCLWGEMIRSRQDAEYMLYPRVLAVAERAWHAAAWETIADQKDYDAARHDDWLQFASAVGHRELRRLDQLGVRYRLPRPGVLYKSGKFEVSTEFPGLSVKYSVDNGHTWSKISTSSLNASESTTYLFVTRSPDGRRISRPVRINVRPQRH